MIRYTLPLMLFFIFSALGDSYSVNIVHPAEEALIGTDEFIVVVVLNTEKDSTVSPVSPVSCRLVFDNRDTSRYLPLSGNTAVWTGTSDTEFNTISSRYGKRTVYAAFLDSNDLVLAEKTWQFTLLKPVKAEKSIKQKITHDGRVFSELHQYRLNGKNRTDVSAGVNYRGHQGKLDFGSDLFLGNLNEPESQDRNQYRVYLNVGRAARFIVGDARTTMNPLVLHHKRIRGLETQLRAFTREGKNPVNIHVALGQAQRAARPDTYRRALLGSRLSFGAEEKVQFGLSFLKGKDKPGSISFERDSIRTISGPPQNDTLYTITDPASAKDNVVIGADFSARFFKKQIRLYTQGALSLHTKDITDTIDMGKLDLPIDLNWLSNILVVNQSTTPINSTAKGLFNSAALNSGLQVNIPIGSVQQFFHFNHRFQGANYYSMGVPVMGTPRQGFSISEHISLLENRLTVRGGYSRYANNYDGVQRNATITTRYALNASFFYSAKVPGITLSFQNNNSHNPDTAFGFRNNVNFVNLSGMYNYGVGDLFGTARLFAGWSGISNKWHMNSYNDTGRIFSGDTATSFSSGIYGITFTAQKNMSPLSTTITLMTNAGSPRLLRFYSGTALFRYNLLGDQLTLRAGVRIGSSRGPADSGYRFLWKIPYGASFNHSAGHRLYFDGYANVRDSEWDVINTLKYEWYF